MFPVKQPDVMPGPQIDLRHHVLLTETNGEFRARDFLTDIGFRPYVPIEETVKYRTIKDYFGSQRRKVESIEPLFRGYIFVPLNQAWSFGPLYESPGLRKPNPFLMRDNRPVVASERDIREIRRIELCLADPSKPSFPFKVGDKVRLIDHPFDECISTVARLDEADRITLLMDILGRKTKFFASAGQIEAV